MSNRDLRRKRPLPPAAGFASWLTAPSFDPAPVSDHARPPDRAPSESTVPGVGPFCATVELASLVELARQDTLRPGRGSPEDCLLRRHVSACLTCRRWYRSARRAAAAVLRERTRATLWRAPGPFPSDDPDQPRYVLIPARGGGAGLDGKDAILCLHRGEASWSLQVRFPSLAEDAERGSETTSLRPWSPCAVLVLLEGEEQRWKVPTVMGLDPATGSLVTPVEPAPLASPHRLERVRVVLLPPLPDGKV